METVERSELILMYCCQYDMLVIDNSLKYNNIPFQSRRRCPFLPSPQAVNPGVYSVDVSQPF